MIREISTSDGQPTTFYPLVLIVLISAVKDMVEDFKRHRADHEENSRVTHLLKENGRFEATPWREIRIGDVVKIDRNEYFPCDMLILSTSDNKKYMAYIETKNLDGETNLKHKVAPKEIAKEFTFSETGNNQMYNQKLQFEYEKPNPYLYQFKGSIQKSNGETVPLDHNNFVLRGCSLRNTDWIVGVVAYSGHDTKIMLNSIKAKSKQSKVERIMNKLIIVVFLLQVVLCLLASFAYLIWYAVNKDYLPYLRIDRNGIVDNSAMYNFFVRFGNWMLIFSNFVPISLLVTLEMVKFIQGYIIANDWKLKSGETAAVVQSSNLNEELGQIHYIFSDKTGTLTCNLMEFKKVSIGGVSYGEKRDLPNASNFPEVSNVDFKDKMLFDDLQQPGTQRYNNIQSALFLIALCHTIIVEENKETHERSYNVRRISSLKSQVDLQIPLCMCRLPPPTSLRWSIGLNSVVVNSWALMKIM